MLTQGVFETISVNTDKLRGTKVFGSRLVDKIKGKEILILYEKSYLVIQAFDNKGKRDILTQSLIIQRSSQRLIAVLAPILIE